MTVACYGHLKFNDWSWFEKACITTFVIISWGIALFEYCLQVPANRIVYKETLRSFTLIQLKIIQEITNPAVLALFVIFHIKTEIFRWNNIAVFFLIADAVYLLFKKQKRLSLQKVITQQVQ